MVTFKNLPYGEYTLTETKAPEGYQKTVETWKVIVNNDGATIEGQTSVNGIYAISNAPLSTSISFYKKSNYKPLTNFMGAEFTVSKYAINDTELENVIDSKKVVSVEGGLVTVNDIYYGYQYVIRETNPLFGHLLSDEQWVITTSINAKDRKSVV